jgi:hypothetical protein
MSIYFQMCGSCLKYYILLLVLLPLDVFAQTGTKISLPESDESKTESRITRHSLYSGAGYGSNMIYLGSSVSQNQPYGYVNLTYGYRNKLFASASAVHLSGLNPFLAFYIGALNFNHAFNSWFDIAASASRYQVPSSLTDTLFSSFTYSDLTLGFDWKLLYSKLSIGGLFSEENQIYFQLRNSRYFQTPDFFKGKTNISFDPYVNLLAGTLIEITTSAETSVIASSPGRKWRRYYTSHSIPELSTSKEFGIMEIDFGLPVDFNTDFMTVEAEINYVLPMYKNPAFKSPKGFVFMLSAFFRIF